MVYQRLFNRTACFLLVASISALLGGIVNAADPVDFNFHIRPLLSDRCFKCHGPDERSRKAKLRLDTEEGSRAWVDESKKLRAITPGKPGNSDVFHRITSKDPDELMPPPDSNLKLDSKEIELLKNWIAQGAKYQKHWAFLSVQKPNVPKVKDRWIRNPIDSFVYTRLKSASLKPSVEADRETLIRRLSFDLTGLPPTPAEIDQFLKDKSAQAYENLVDRLLASPSYGEHMASEWVDLARYADTYGYQSDADRDMYPWRDWVIRALNSNLPYDEFIKWQIAGDLLPNATDEQILATAFNRLHRQTNEGGSIEEEFRVEYVADRVHTFGTAMLGLTMECSRCHDHKYDPITQKNYYELSAFFNNIDESGLYSHFTQATPSPTMLLYGEGQKEKHLALKKKISDKEASLNQIAEGAEAEFQQWFTTNGAKWLATNGTQWVLPTPLAHFTFDQVADGKTSDTSTRMHGTLSDNPEQVEGWSGKSILFNGESSITIKDVAHFNRTDAFSFGLWLKPTELQDRAMVMHHSKSWTDAGSRGYELLLQHGKPRFALIHFWPGNAIAIQARSPLPLNQWTHVAVTYDGSSRASGIKLFINGKPAEQEVIKDNLPKDILHRGEWGDAEVGNVHLTLGARFRDSGLKKGLIDELLIFDKCLTALEVANFNPLAPSYINTDLARKKLFTHFLERVYPAYTNGFTELGQMRREENNFANDIREIMVMREMPQPRPTFRLKRGSYEAPAEAVVRGTPEGIFSFSPELPQNRLGLAQWTTDKRNPLTARVAVNRVWRSHFGRGLVATPEDFGSQGRLPTHPELLDWLSADFMENGWDVKRLHKLIVTSAAYRQSSKAAPELVAADPENMLLSRGPRHRLAAEQIRDNALKTSGLLIEHVGGPSVKPYQPAGLWEQSGLSKSYAQDSGDNLYRRSLYSFWRRTSPPPSMTTFDATSRELCTAKRETTTTPLQALVLMNDPQFIEAARFLAEQLFRNNPANKDRITQAFRIVLGRKPSTRELEISTELLAEQLEVFQQDTEAVEKLLSIGAKPRDKTLAGPELAATTMLVSTLMNHDEFVTKR